MVTVKATVYLSIIFPFQHQYKKTPKNPSRIFKQRQKTRLLVSEVLLSMIFQFLC